MQELVATLTGIGIYNDSLQPTFGAQSTTQRNGKLLFKSFTDGAKCNLNIKAEGVNEHHKIEGIFKAFAKAMKMAVKRDVNKMFLPSSKGML